MNRLTIFMLGCLALTSKTLASSSTPNSQSDDQKKTAEVKESSSAPNNSEKKKSLALLLKLAEVTSEGSGGRRSISDKIGKDEAKRLREEFSGKK